MAAGPTARLFLAVWPDAAAREALVDWQRRWHWPRGARPTAPDRLHLTLHFIGQVPMARIAEVAAGLAVDFEPFELSFSRPALWRGGLALAMPETVPPALTALHGRLADALQALALPVERRPFKPHLTLAREADGAVPPDEPLTCRWTADAYALVQSAGGYRTLRRYPAR
ncbi:MAG: RNA 2',3'-cyclic phosphodiesterase [Rubrivivax sp.]